MKEHIVALIVAILGSGGVGAVITSLLSARKYKAEANSLEQENEKSRKLFETEMNERIHKQFAELAEIHKKEAEYQREQTKILEKQITGLKNQVTKLMSWIMTEDASYRSFLENEILRLNPDFVFPKLKPIPGMDNEVLKAMGFDAVDGEP